MKLKDVDQWVRLFNFCLKDYSMVQAESELQRSKVGFSPLWQNNRGNQLKEEKGLTLTPRFRCASVWPALVLWWKNEYISEAHGSRNCSSHCSEEAKREKRKQELWYPVNRYSQLSCCQVTLPKTSTPRKASRLSTHRPLEDIQDPNSSTRVVLWF